MSAFCSVFLKKSKKKMSSIGQNVKIFMKVSLCMALHACFHALSHSFSIPLSLFPSVGAIRHSFGDTEAFMRLRAILLFSYKFWMTKRRGANHALKKKKIATLYDAWRMKPHMFFPSVPPSVRFD